MSGKYFPWVVQRASKKDRGNGTSVTITRYLTYAGGWTRFKKKAHGWPSFVTAQKALGKRDGEIVNLHPS